jgi:predicted transcriptional regulator
MKKIYIIDGNVIENTVVSSKLNILIPTISKKTIRYILLIFEHENILDGQTYLLGFGIKSDVNKKMITSHSIKILLYYLTKLMNKIRHTLKYTVDIGSLSDYNNIENIKIKHTLKNVKNEYIIDLDDELINNFLLTYYGKL